MSMSDYPVFTAQVAEAEGLLVLHLAGELDIAAAAEMRRASLLARSQWHRRLAVDMSDVSFMDARGLASLMELNDELNLDGGPRLSVRGAAGIVRRIFQLTNMAFLLDDAERTVDESAIATNQRPTCGDLASTRFETGISVQELYVGYVALGGTATFSDMVAHLRQPTGAFDIHQQDVAIHALNERLTDLGREDRLLSYASG